MTDDGAAAARSPRTSCSCATPGCGRSWCTAAARRSPRSSTGSASSRVSRPACGSPPRRRWTSSGWCSSARCSASSSACSTRTARSPSACPARTPTCSPPSRTTLDGRRRAGRHRPGRRRRRGRHPASSRACSTTAGSRSSPPSPAAPTASSLQRQRRHRRRRARRRARAPRSSSSSPTSRGSTPTGPTDASDDVISRSPPTSSRSCCPTLSTGMVPEDGGLPARRPRRRAQGARHRRPGPARAPARGLHRRGRRHDGRAIDDRCARDRRTPARVAGRGRCMDDVRRRRRWPWSAATGATVWDADGNALLDLVGGIAVNALGHAHPAVVEAVTRAGRHPRAHVATSSPTSRRVRLAERLLALTGRDGQGVLRQLRRRGQRGRVQDRPAHRPHRRWSPPRAASTAAPWARSRSPASRPSATPFEPLPGGVTFVPYGDAAALRAAVGRRTAAVVLEPVQGEGGVVAAAGRLPRGGPRRSRRGTARCWSSTRCRPASAAPAPGSPTRRDGVEPDVVTLAKGLGGGLPIGACLAFGDAADAARARAARHARSAATRSPAPPRSPCSTPSSGTGLLEHAKRARRAARGAASTALGHPLVDQVRGAGLLLGIVLTAPVAAAVEAAARDAGFLVNAAAPDVVRLAPPLVLTDAQADAFLSALPGDPRRGYASGRLTDRRDAP